MNAIPDRAEVESYVRALHHHDLPGAGEDVDRSMAAGAITLGAEQPLKSVARYLPLYNHEGLSELLHRNARRILGEGSVGEEARSSTATTVVGDVSWTLPTIQSMAGGMAGLPHTSHFILNEFKAAILDPEKIVAAAIVDIAVDRPPNDVEFTNKPYGSGRDTSIHGSKTGSLTAAHSLTVWTSAVTLV